MIIALPHPFPSHPEGIVAQGSKDLRRQAGLLINAVAPCVHYDLKLMDSDSEAEAHA